MSAKLTLYHSNPSGTGAAMQMELVPASEVDNRGGIMLTLAPQIKVEGGFDFDWSKKVTVMLGFNALSQFLQVFRGECESLHGGWIFRNTVDYMETIKLDHRLDPTPCYALEVIYHQKTGEDSRVVFLMNSAEALGICEAIASSMGKIAFGEEA